MSYALAWAGVTFEEPERINRVVVYTVDSAGLPAAKYGVSDLRLFYRKSSSLGFSNWVEAQVIGNTTKKKSLMECNKKGIITFRIKPVKTDAIRIMIIGANDSQNTRQGSLIEGCVRLVEIEAYGFEKKPIISELASMK